ncbi:MAG: hypothetical protein IT168_23815 [Bryobacterales bacterium]|nr:hypothetical protein [Bryobacterales bacterium]
MQRRLVRLLILIAGTASASIVPPFTGGVFPSNPNNLVPQTGPTFGSGTYAILEFGYARPERTTRFARGDISSSRTWDKNPGAYGSAAMKGGDISVYSSVKGPSLPDGQDEMFAHARVDFFDTVFVSSDAVSDGSLGYFELTVHIEGDFGCEASKVAYCPIGIDFGYWGATLSRGAPVDFHGGESPPAPAARIDVDQPLVPLPFIFGKPFNIGLELAATSRLIRWMGNTSAFSDMSHTMTVNSIRILDADHVPIDLWSIEADSGLSYKADGISAVPEPGTSVAGFAATAAAAVSVWRKRRKARRT